MKLEGLFWCYFNISSSFLTNQPIAKKNDFRLKVHFGGAINIGQSHTETSTPNETRIVGYSNDLKTTAV